MCEFKILETYDPALQHTLHLLINLIFYSWPIYTNAEANTLRIKFNRNILPSYSFYKNDESGNFLLEAKGKWKQYLEIKWCRAMLLKAYNKFNACVV